MNDVKIKIKEGKWFYDNKPFEKLTKTERQELDKFFSKIKNRLEKVNTRLKNLKSHNHKFKKR